MIYLDWRVPLNFVPEESASLSYLSPRTFALYILKLKKLKF